MICRTKRFIVHLKSRLWFHIFLQVAAIFAVFVSLLTLANSTLLSSFYAVRERNALATQLIRVSKLDIEDSHSVSALLSEINDEHNFDVEIYTEFGKILYTTHGGQMMDYIIINRDDFIMSHAEMETVKSQTLSNGAVFEEAVMRPAGAHVLLCRMEIANGVFAETRIQKQYITSSANTASEFITIMAGVFFVISVVWIFFFARRFSRPLTNMSQITSDMAMLNFERKLSVERTDEIGQLASSINHLSDSLSRSLSELRERNMRLRDEIELERSLDVMRRAFVANVSHELKTPISIINGYAEGLKLNVNSESREMYCDTIIDESKRMHKLVLSILELSRYESGQMPISKECFDISPMCDTMLMRIFKGKAVTATNAVPTGTMVFADPIQIEQVLKSYLENAASHTPAGGNVEVQAVANGENTRILVHNTGSSVQEDAMPQIWQSFYRGDSSHKREESRFGLGLSIVSAIMKMHGGDCGVYNTCDGVTFWFELPRANSGM